MGHFIASCPCGCRISGKVTVLRAYARAGTCLVQLDGTGIRWKVRAHTLVWVRSAA